MTVQRSIANFQSAAAQHQGRLKTTGMTGVSAGKDNAWFKSSTDKSTLKDFRTALIREYGQETANDAIAKYNLTAKDPKTGATNQLTGKKVLDVVKFCKSKPKTLLGKRHQRASAAKNALRFFKNNKRGNNGGQNNRWYEQKGIKSTNNPFSLSGNLIYNQPWENKLDEQRKTYPNSVVGNSTGAMVSGMGNCDEKACILASNLMSHPQLQDCHVTLVAAKGYDHVFVVVTDEPIPSEIDNISQLGKDAMIVDGWTEDFYFPNQTNRLRKKPSNGVPNPRQTYVRHQVHKHGLKVLDKPVMTEVKTREDIPAKALSQMENYIGDDELTDIKKIQHQDGTVTFTAQAKTGTISIHVLPLSEDEYSEIPSMKLGYQDTKFVGGVKYEMEYKENGDDGDIDEEVMYEINLTREDRFGIEQEVKLRGDEKYLKNVTFEDSGRENNTHVSSELDLDAPIGNVPLNGFFADDEFAKLKNDNEDEYDDISTTNTSTQGIVPPYDNEESMIVNTDHEIEPSQDLNGFSTNPVKSDIV